MQMYANREEGTKVRRAHWSVIFERQLFDIISSNTGTVTNQGHLPSLSALLLHYHPRMTMG